MNSVDIGKYLAELRKYYKITQDELAGRIGVTRQAVSKWETGMTIPDIEMLLKLSEIYGIAINDILRADSSKINFQKNIVFPNNDKRTKRIELIRFYYGTDLIGNEIGAATKNIIGIAAGMLEGFDLSSLKGALMARGTNEIARLIVAMGGKSSTVYGLCHLGDYEATLFSKHSHNLSFGKKFVQGIKYDELAEGYYTVKAVRKLGKAYGVELPICNAVYDILYEGKEPKTILKKLFDRSLKNEFIVINE